MIRAPSPVPASIARASRASSGNAAAYDSNTLVLAAFASDASTSPTTHPLNPAPLNRAPKTPRVAHTISRSAFIGAHPHS